MVPQANATIDTLVTKDAYDLPAASALVQYNSPYFRTAGRYSIVRLSG
jgi:hypothetical protein